MSDAQPFNTGLWLVNTTRLFVIFAISGLILWAMFLRSPLEAEMLKWSALCLMAFGLPYFFKPSFDLLVPHFFLLLLVVHGVILRAIYLVDLGIESQWLPIDFLGGKSAASLLEGIKATSLFGIGIAVGFLPLIVLFKRHATIHSLKPIQKESHSQLLSWVLGGGCLISIFGFFLMVRGMGVNLANPAEWSSIRFLVGYESSGQQTYLEASGYWFYRIANLAKIFFYVGVIHLVIGSFPRKSVATFFCLICGGLSVIVPIFVGSRINAGLIFFDVAVISLILGFLVRPVYLVAGAAVMLTLVGGIYGSRAGNIKLGTVLQSFVVNRDLLDAAKTGAIIESVPSKLPHLGGETLYGWAALPIPRSIWPDKPISIEQASILDAEVFGGGGYSGTPPGLVGELFWNFGTSGVFFGGFALGILLGLGGLTFRYFSRSYVIRAVYGLVALRIGLFVVGNSVGVGILKIALEVGPILFLLLLIELIGSWKQGLWTQFNWRSVRSNVERLLGTRHFKTP